MVKRERAPLSLFAASPSSWPSPPARDAPVPSDRCAFLACLPVLPSPFSRRRRGRGAGGCAPSRRFAPGMQREAAGKRFSSLDVAGLLHCGFGRGLRLGERRIDGHRAGERGREVLTDVRADALELGDRDELDAGIRHRLHGRVIWVGRIDRPERQLRPRGGLGVVGVLVQRGARPGRNASPAVLRGDQVGVVLAGRP